MAKTASPQAIHRSRYAAMGDPGAGCERETQSQLSTGHELSSGDGTIIRRRPSCMGRSFGTDLPHWLLPNSDALENDMTRKSFIRRRADSPQTTHLKSIALFRHGVHSRNNIRPDFPVTQVGSARYDGYRPVAERSPLRSG